MLYSALAVLVCGLGHALWRYLRAPVPLNIVLPPAPRHVGGVIARLVREVFLFSSLFKANFWTGLLGYALHWALLLEALRHLRFLFEPVPQWLWLLQTPGLYAGKLLPLVLLALLVRRAVVPALRYISTPSDYLWLLLLLASAISGLAMRLYWYTDVVEVKEFIQGLLGGRISSVPEEGLLLLHLSLAALLMLLLPFSKLLHGPALFLAPSRVQRAPHRPGPAPRSSP